MYRYSRLVEKFLKADSMTIVNTQRCDTISYSEYVLTLII